MQQAGQATTSRLNASGGNALPAAVPDPAFVINLCASTTPMALPRPDHPELKRFAFFISRRREDGRERFRLHMGYFFSQEEAEQLLELVREIYPAAWAGVAPGQRLRAAAAAGALSDGPAGSLPQPAAAPPPVAMQPAESPPLAAQPVAPPPIAAVPAAVPPAVMSPSAPPPPHVAATAPAAPAAPVVAAPAAAPMSAAAQSLHSVRAAIDALEGTAPSRSSSSPPTLGAAPNLRAVPVARPVAPTLPAPPSAAQPAAPTLAPLDSRQVLRVLETPAPAPAARAEVAGYAVQLLWSVQPIEMSGVPQLAIFSAYTLYGAAGNRDGRRWYGLRLGFFTDAVSAKQVANYVRSEFASVSIVPVSARERDRALAAAPRAPLPEASLAPKQAAINIASSGEFRLLEEHPAAKVLGAGTLARATRGAPGKRAKLRAPAAGGNGAAVPKRRPPLSLEETLEILGAGELKLQDGREDPLNDSGVRHLRMEAMKGPRASRFSKLMERLSDRFGGG
jgi:Meckel syndrome type 1 protein